MFSDYMDMEQDHLRGFLRGAIPSFLTYDCSALLPLGYSVTETIPETTPALGVLMANAILKDIPNQRNVDGDFGIYKLFHPWVMAEEDNAYRLLCLASLYTRAIMDTQPVTQENAVLMACEAAYAVLCGHWLARSSLLYMVRPTDLVRFLQQWRSAVGIHEQTHSILAHHRAHIYAGSFDGVPTITPLLLDACGYDCDRMNDLGLLRYFINSANSPVLFGDHPILMDKNTLLGVEYIPIPPALETHGEQVAYVNMRRFGATGQRRPVDVLAKKHYPDFTAPAVLVNSSYLQCNIILRPQYSSHRFARY
jgi:hypothetical protein